MWLTGLTGVTGLTRLTGLTGTVPDFSKVLKLKLSMTDSATRPTPRYANTSIFKKKLFKTVASEGHNVHGCLEEAAHLGTLLSRKLRKTVQNNVRIVYAWCAR